MNPSTSSGEKRTKNDGNLILSQLFAQVFQAYLECGDEIQAVVRHCRAQHHTLQLAADAGQPGADDHEAPVGGSLPAPAEPTGELAGP